MNVSELRSKSIDELKSELLAVLKEQFSLRMQQESAKQPKGHLLRRVRVKIARIKTILAEKGLPV